MPFVRSTGMSLQVEVGAAVGLRLVARRRHDAVAVRVDDVAVHERLAREVGAVEPARRDRAPGAISPSIEVAVDVDVTDLVVGLQVLQRSVRRPG